MAAARAAAHPPGMQSTRQISVVDDDDSFRESVVGYIRSAGFSVKGFASAEGSWLLARWDRPTASLWTCACRE